MKIFIPGISVTDSCKEAMEDWKAAYPALPVFSTSAEAWACAVGFCESYEHIYAGVLVVNIDPAAIIELAKVEVHPE